MFFYFLLPKSEKKYCEIIIFISINLFSLSNTSIIKKKYFDYPNLMIGIDF